MIIIKNITEKEREDFNSIATHPLQSYEWGEFREKTGIKVIRRGFYDNEKIIAGFQLTIHKIPRTSWTIGYLPKGIMPTEIMQEELVKTGKENKCIFIQLEPNIEKNQEKEIMIHDSKFLIYPSAHPLFTRYTFQLDLTKSEDELLKNMHSKTRYNIRVAQKHGVEVKEEQSSEAFQEYLKLTGETTRRQGFFAHTKKYHQLMWETLGRQKSKVPQAGEAGKSQKLENELSAHLLIASYKPATKDQRPISLTTWILF